MFSKGFRKVALDMVGMASKAGDQAKKLYNAGKPLAQKAGAWAAKNPGKALAGAAVGGGLAGAALAKSKKDDS